METGDEDEDTSDDPERWLAVHGEGSREGYRDDELARWPGELERWHAISEERQRGRARSWLAAAGYRALPVDPRDS